MIWQQLPKPFFVLAPMEDVTDTVFRQIINSCGRPDVSFTEFTNVDGFFSVGRHQVAQRLVFTPGEKPLIAQIWGLTPENYFKAAKKLGEMGFDGIDINMGCPQPAVIKKGACSALINNHTLAAEIIQATKEGSGGLPVSVKTRLGFKTNQREEWIDFLLSQDISALTIHGRTAAQMSAVPANWEEIGNVVEMRNKKEVKTLIIGNGDVMSLSEAKEKVATYGVDGVMIGRGVFHNPWLFNEQVDIETVSLEKRLQLLLSHTKLYVETWKDEKPFQVLKKYFKIYVNGFANASDLRAQLMTTTSLEEVYKIVDPLLSK
ncbi:MAG TPA: tRNA-dihydrouridine synthase [Patescibacteria group bacterium]|nr:tRNA-dihydrouridine synthase [Patescibacteria group bacterium]